MKKHRIYSISVASVYPHYLAKAAKKGGGGPLLKIRVHRFDDGLRLHSTPDVRLIRGHDQHITRSGEPRAGAGCVGE